MPAGPDRQVGKGTGDPFGQLLDARAFGGVVAGQDQTDVEGLRLKGAVEPCLAGQQDVGPGLRRIAQEIVARAAGDGHALDRLPGIADHLDGDVAESPRDEEGELLEAAAAPVIGRRGRIPSGAGIVEWIDVDRRLFVGVAGPDRREDRAEPVPGQTISSRSSSTVSRLPFWPTVGIGLLGAEERPLPRDRERAFGVGADPPGTGFEGRRRARPGDRTRV